MHVRQTVACFPVVPGLQLLCYGKLKGIRTFSIPDHLCKSLLLLKYRRGGEAIRISHLIYSLLITQWQYLMIDIQMPEKNAGRTYIKLLWLLLLLHFCLTQKAWNLSSHIFTPNPEIPENARWVMQIMRKRICSGADFLKVCSENEENRAMRVVESILSLTCCLWPLQIPEYIGTICKDCNK